MPRLAGGAGAGLAQNLGHFYWMVEPALCDFYFRGGRQENGQRAPRRRKFAHSAVINACSWKEAVCTRVVLSIMPPRLWLVDMDHSVLEEGKSNKKVGMEIASWSRPRRRRGIAKRDRPEGPGGSMRLAYRDPTRMCHHSTRWGVPPLLGWHGAKSS